MLNNDDLLHMDYAESRPLELALLEEFRARELELWIAHDEATDRESRANRSGGGTAAVAWLAILAFVFLCIAAMHIYH